jgi:pyruvate,orthophosphate dikinase
VRGAAAARAAVWQPALAALEQASGARFGDDRRPLLLSVRSGAPVSMPGMMETLLNIGLCDATVPGLLRLTGNPRLVWDAYRRLVAGFGETVLGVPAAVFEADLQAAAGGRDERELDFAELRALTRAHLASVRRAAGQPFRRTRRPSCRPPSARCWPAGRRPRRWTTAASRTCPTAWAPR